MKKSKGFKHKTRSLLRKKPRERGMAGLSKLLKQYKIGDRVVVKLDPSVHKGMPHRRFHGKIGTVESRRGQAYVVSVIQGNTIKKIIARPEHLESFAA